MTSPARPTLAIVYGDRSASAMALKEAAAHVCDIVWVLDSEHLDDQLMIRLLRKLGQVVDTVGMSDGEAVDALRARRPDGIVAYADEHIATASRLATALGLEYHDAVVAERLLDKVAQRRAFAEAGLGVPRCVAVPREPSTDQIEAVVSDVAFPVVIKPRHGAASRETHYAGDAQTLRDLLTEVSRKEPGTDLVIEEFMVGAQPPPSPYFGDYVSVESVVAHGHISHLTVTGRTPTAKPFRETGYVMPSDFSPALIRDILDVATHAITAVGIRTGCLHTEVKVTDKGPRVLEVNGRIGGFVAPVMSLTFPGIDFLEISQRVALGEEVVVDHLLRSDHVGYVVVEQPPIGMSRVTSVRGLDQLAAYPGVNAVSLSRGPGDAVDWRLGSHEFVYAVLGIAPDPDGVRDLQRFINENVHIGYE